MLTYKSYQGNDDDNGYHSFIHNGKIIYATSQNTSNIIGAVKVVLLDADD
jgi:hypothetical protein